MKSPANHPPKPKHHQLQTTRQSQIYEKSL
jgi:hypothetical protein